MDARKVIFILLIFVVIHFVLLESVFSQCSTTVVCTSVGPPTWTYSYRGTGIGFIFGFRIYGASCVIDSAAPAGFTATTTADGAIYTPDSLTFCGTVDGFTLTSSMAGVSDFIALWEDTGALTSGMTRGPFCPPTPTPTPSFTSTGSPFPTRTPTITPTPTLSPHLELVSAGPPDWTYRWYGSTSGFTIQTDCSMNTSAPSGWVCSKLSWGTQCMKFPSGPVQWYEPFVFTEDPVAINTSIFYYINPSGPDTPIDGPSCVLPTSTPTFTPTTSPTGTWVSPTPTMTSTPETICDTRYPTLFEDVGGSANNEPRAFVCDDLSANIPSGNQELRLSGFNNSIIGVIANVRLTVVYKTSFIPADDTYQFEASLDGTFAAPITIVAPTLATEFAYTSASVDLGAITYAEIGTLAVREKGVLNSPPDPYSVQWDCAYIEILGICYTPSPTPTDTPTSTPTPILSPTNTPTPTITSTFTPTTVPICDTRYPAMFNDIGGGATGESEAFLCDDVPAIIPAGDEELRLSGFDNSSAGIILDVRITVVYRTSTNPNNDTYQFEASLDGTFAAPITIVAPTSVDEPVYTSASVNLGAITYAQIATLEVRELGVRKGGLDAYNVEWDCAYIDIMGICNTPTPTVTPTFTLTPTPTITDTPTISPTPMTICDTRYPTLFNDIVGGATSESEAFVCDTVPAIIPGGFQELRLSGFDNSSAGIILDVRITVVYRTGSPPDNDPYKFEASLDGTFAAPITIVAPTSIDEPVFTSASVSLGPITYAEIATLAVRETGERRGFPDFFNVEWDCAYIEIMGICNTPTPIPVPVSGSNYMILFIFLGIITAVFALKFLEK